MKAVLNQSKTQGKQFSIDPLGELRGFSVFTSLRRFTSRRKILEDSPQQQQQQQHKSAAHPFVPCFNFTPTSAPGGDQYGELVMNIL